MNFDEYSSGIIVITTMLSLLYTWARSYFADYNRLYRHLIENAVLELYAQKANIVQNSYLWLCLRNVLIESFSDHAREAYSLTEFFSIVRTGIGTSQRYSANNEPLLKLVSDLELRIMREFRLYDVSEQYLVMKPVYLYEAISYILDTKGGV